MGDKDYTNSCVEDIRGQGRKFKSFSVKDLRRHFCAGCRQVACGHAKGLGNPWEDRMLTQVERLLENPTFADPDDPRVAHLRSLDFPSLYREAIRLQIAQKRGDWTKPSEAEVEAAMMLGPDLSTVDTSSQVEDAVRALRTKEGSPPASTPPPASPSPPKTEVIQVWSSTKHGVSYDVTVNENGDAVGCTCIGGKYGRRCVHQAAAEEEWREKHQTSPSPPTVSTRQEEVDQEETDQGELSEVPPPGIRPRASVDRPYRNLAQNSPHPQGVMLGGDSPPPAPSPGVPRRKNPVRDAWSSRSSRSKKVSPANVVVTLKGKKKDE